MLVSGEIKIKLANKCYGDLVLVRMLGGRKQCVRRVSQQLSEGQ